MGLRTTLRGKARERELLRPADIASWLGLTTGRIYQLLSDPKLGIPVVTIGKHKFVRRDKFESWLEERTVKGTVGDEVEAVE